MNNRLIFCLLTSILQVGTAFSADCREISLSFNLDKIAKIGLGSINRLKETRGFLSSYPLKSIVPVTLVGGLRYGAYTHYQKQRTKNSLPTITKKSEPIFIKSRYSIEQGIDTKAVSMGSGNFITIAFNEKSENKKSIFSFGFGGCTGTILYALLKNGEQRAALTHYPPTDTPAHLSQIRQLSNRLKGGINCNEIIKTVGIIFHPIGWVKNLETGYYIAKGPSDAHLVDRLKKVIDAELPYNNTLIQELYALSKGSDEYHPGGMFGDKIVPKELEIVLSPDPAESYFHSKATYHKKQKLCDL
jgi:hypothetical protein